MAQEEAQLVRKTFKGDRLGRYWLTKVRKGRCASRGGGGSPEALVEGNLGLLITVWPGAAWPTVVGECVNISITIAH